MKTPNKTIRKSILLMLFGTLFSGISLCWAESDKSLQEKTLKAREMVHMKDMDHAAHMAENDENGLFRGVFYGYLPCSEKDCDGIKMTLSLKQKSNYLLVTQPAKALTREYYDKGKYEWDDAKHIVTLVSNKDGSKRLFTIKDEGQLVYLNNDGSPLGADQDDYTLARSDKNKSREVHIH